MNGLTNQNRQQATVLTAAEVISRLVAFIVIVRLINFLGDTAYGELSYAFALANIIVIVADFGLSTYAIKQFAHYTTADTEQRKHFAQVLLLKLVLVITALGLIVLAGLLTTNLSGLTIVGGGCAIVFTNTRMFIEALFRAQQRMAREGITKMAHAIILALVLLYGITQQFTLEQFALAYGIVALLAALGTISWLWQLPLKPQWHDWRSSYWHSLIIAAWPFAASFGINALFNYLDSVMLGWFGQFKAAGWYNTAYKPIFFLTALAGMVINAYLPTIAKIKHSGQPSQLSAKVQELFNTTMMLAWPMMIGGTLVADKIFAVLFKPEFAPGILAFQILLWSTGCIYAWAVFGNSLQVCGKEKVYLKNFGLAVLVTIVGNILLIPFFSLYGAAVTTLLTQITLVILMYRDWKTITPISLSHGLLPPVISSGIMGAAVWLVHTAALWLILPLAAIVYTLCLLLLKKLIKPI
ncbi:MAG: lipopolysaccharide O-side chain biosynthesis protein (O-antigen transporter) [uncultured bacterium]|nr:MAG: lipopolysaccharide O-side chain biosynthesis protein (O-antigen transporter) [uncultured bacterium]